MEKVLLFINRSDDETALISEQELMQKAVHADKEVLLEIIKTILDNNRTLRKYIELLEREYKYY